MKLKERDLLTKEIMTRIPYGTRFAIKPTNPDYDLPYSGNHRVETVYIREDGEYNFCFENHGYVLGVENIKPYLRPMSSMTEEEDHEFAMLQTDFYKDGWLYPMVATNIIKWLNEHHFDYSQPSLIESGLAKEAPYGMYGVITSVKINDEELK